MSDKDHRNGRDVMPLLEPLPPPRPKVREIPRAALTDGDRARNYGTIAAAYNEHLPHVYQELDLFRAAINTLPERMLLMVRRAVAEAFEVERENLHDHVQRELQDSVPDAEEVEEAARRGAAQGVADATGPHIIPIPKPSDSERLKRIAGEHEIQRKAQLYDEARDTRRKVFIAAAATVIATIILATLAVGWRLASERAAGVAEGQAHPRIVEVPIPVPTAPPAAPEPPPATAPASVAPRHR